MSEESAVALQNRRVKIQSPLPETDINLKAAEVRDGLSIIPEITIEFMTTNAEFRIDQIIGQAMGVGIRDADDEWRMKHGTCVSVQFLGIFSTYAVYSATIRPWLWFLTQRKDNRIFQNMNSVDIIREVLSDAGFSGNIDNKLSESYAEREYCVQFDETDYAFICRLMEEEGIYFYFDFSGDVEKMVFADGQAGHSAGPGGKDITYAFEGSAVQMREDTIFRWLWAKNVISGKVTLDDYDFTKARTDLMVARPMPSGEHAHKDYEIYEYPGGYTETDLGETRARVKMEALARQWETWHATSNVRTLSVGDTFELKEHPRDDQNAEYMVTESVFQYQIEPELREEFGLQAPGQAPQRGQAVQRQSDAQGRNVQAEEPPGRLEFVKEHTDAFRCRFTAIPKTTQFRAPLNTPWPTIAGLHTAEVVGPGGEEIYTDEFGRIKVQFHWDRVGNKDENSSCWIRTMNPWTGRQWGMVSIPRIGQEVVIQFEGGDPDRPVVVGALYNDVNMPPYTLPEDKMISGVKTDRYKGGGGFHELIMDDDQGNELVRFQSERDYEQIVKNDATITIGKEHKSPGNLTQTIQNDKTEVLELGNYSQDTKAGKATVKAAISIELICGASSIKIEPGKITMTTPVFSVDAKATAEVKSGISTTVKSNLSTTVSGSVNVTVRGGTVLIN